MLKIILLASLLLLTALLILWNTGPVTIRFFKWTKDIPAVVLIFISFAAGLLTCVLLRPILGSGRRPKKTQEPE